MGGLALDTSVIVAGLQSWHVHHEPTSAFPVQALASGHEIVVPLPALVEADRIATSNTGDFERLQRPDVVVVTPLGTS